MHMTTLCLKIKRAQLWTQQAGCHNTQGGRQKAKLMLINAILSNGRKQVWDWASYFWPAKTSWSSTSWRNKVWLKCTMIEGFKMRMKVRQRHVLFCKTTAALSFGARPLSSQTFTRDSAVSKRSTTFHAATKSLARTRFPSALARCRPSTEIRTSILCRSSS